MIQQKLLVTTSLLLGLTLALLYVYSPMVSSQTSLRLAFPVRTSMLEAKYTAKNTFPSDPAKDTHTENTGTKEKKNQKSLLPVVLDVQLTELRESEQEGSATSDIPVTNQTENLDNDCFKSAWKYAVGTASDSTQNNTENVYDRNVLYKQPLLNAIFKPLDASLEQKLTRERRINQVVYTKDILAQPPLPFLDNYRNPCWYESVHPAHDYGDSYYTKPRKAQVRASILHDFYHCAAPSRFATRRWRLRCLPYFMILGMPKCGTTDLFFKLIRHQSIVWGATPKEPHWWSRKRYEKNLTFSEYVDAYDLAAEEIMRDVTEQGEHHLIIGEGSASTLWDSRELYPSLDTNLTSPWSTSAHQIRHVLPRTRFIVILRNPTERLFSDYSYFEESEVVSVEDFHRGVSFTVQVMQRCVVEYPVRECTHQVSLQNKYRNELCAEDKNYCDEIFVRLKVGMYAVFLREWFAVFPQEQFFIVRLEEYSNARIETLNKIAHFLGIDPYDPEIAANIMESTQLNTNKEKKQEMLPETKELLDQFYKPYNKQLAHILQDDKYLEW